MARMKEDMISEIEATAKDYGLEQYPINGAEIAALIEGYRHYEKLAKLAAPMMEIAYRQRLHKKVGERYAFHRVGVLFLTLTMVGVTAAFTHTYERLFLALQQPSGTVEAAIALGMIVLSCLIPMLVFFIPAMKWIDKRAAEYYEMLENKEMTE